MRDNGDDAFGEPLPRTDRPVHVSSSVASSSSLPTTSSFPLSTHVFAYWFFIVFYDSIGSFHSISPTCSWFWTFKRDPDCQYSFDLRWNVQLPFDLPVVMIFSHNKSLYDQLIRRLTQDLSEIFWLRSETSSFPWSIDLVNWLFLGILRNIAFDEEKCPFSKMFIFNTSPIWLRQFHLII